MPPFNPSFYIKLNVWNEKQNVTLNQLKLLKQHLGAFYLDCPLSDFPLQRQQHKGGD